MAAPLQRTAPVVVEEMAGATVEDTVTLLVVGASPLGGRCFFRHHGGNKMRLLQAAAGLQFVIKQHGVFDFLSNWFLIRLDFLPISCLFHGLLLLLDLWRLRLCTSTSVGHDEKGNRNKSLFFKMSCAASHLTDIDSVGLRLREWRSAVYDTFFT